MGVEIVYQIDLTQTVWILAGLLAVAMICFTSVKIARILSKIHVDLAGIPQQVVRNVTGTSQPASFSAEASPTLEPALDQSKLMFDIHSRRLDNAQALSGEIQTRQEVVAGAVGESVSAMRQLVQ